MKMEKRLRTFVTFSLVIFLYGCGVAHVKTEVAASDRHQYSRIYISDVRVYSEEKAAKDNAELKTKMEAWELFARGQLENYIKDSHYQLIDIAPTGPEAVLVANLDINVVYGNRALRYWVGFGAGKGSVDSLLIFTDSKTNEEKFRAVSESDLSIGGFGGDMEAVLKENIRELVDQYSETP